VQAPSKKYRFLLLTTVVLFVFACSTPALIPSAPPTMDASALSTAIAQTANAAMAGTSAVSQEASPVPQQQVLPASGQATLDPNSLNTLIAQTAAAAATQTAALLPPTLTPSVTTIPTGTPSITPSPTETFVFLLPTFTKTSTPRPIPTATKTKKSSGGGGGGGGGGGHGGASHSYSCNVISVSPPSGTHFNPGHAFSTIWTVKNTGDNWPGKSLDLVYNSGDMLSTLTGYDVSPYMISGGDTFSLPAVSMTSPGAAGTYTTNWQLHLGHDYFCDMSLSIIVDAPPTNTP